MFYCGMCGCQKMSSFMPVVEKDFRGRARVEKLDWLHNILLKGKTNNKGVI